MVSSITHDFLDCGIEYAVLPLPRRRVAYMEIRFIAGMSEEPPDKLGLAQLVDETLTKGTENYSARELSDAFDRLGVMRGSGVGRETTTFTCAMLPEYFEQAVELHAEFLRRPTFPPEMIDVNLELMRQEHASLQDDPHELTDKLINRYVYGSVLGRHPFGEPETLRNIIRHDVVDHWKKHFGAGRMQVGVAGRVDPSDVAEVFQKYFQGFGFSTRQGRTPHAVEFHPIRAHQPKDLEQEHIRISYPGVEVTHEDYPAQRVMLGVLAGGMSGRLFTEVREKQGLVYWVSAWQGTPRGAGMIFLGASTTPDRCDRTYQTLLREIERLNEDLTQEEVDRAAAGITAKVKTRGALTRSLCAELADDLFHRGKIVPVEEKMAQIQAVTVRDVQDYLARYPRDKFCVATLGPRELQNGA